MTEESDKNFYVHDSAYIDNPVNIGDGTRIWHFCHIRSGAKIGKDCNIGQNVFIGAQAEIGNSCKIQNNVSIYDGVKLEDYVFCGPSMVFTNDLNPRAEYPKGDSHRVSTLVKTGASICANATIVCGYSIGRYAFVAAGAVVTKDVPDYAAVRGVPARQFGWMCRCGEFLKKEKRCPKCGRTYRLTSDERLEEE